MGAGKTTLSKRIEKLTGAKAHHQDCYFYGLHFKSQPLENWKDKVSSIATPSGSWVIDGNYFDAFEEKLLNATDLVYLDLSSSICIQRALSRTLRNFCKFKTDSGLSEKVNLSFIINIFTYRSRRGEEFENAFQLAIADGKHVHRLTSQSELEAFVYKLTQTDPQTSKLPER